MRQEPILGSRDIALVPFQQAKGCTCTRAWHLTTSNYKAIRKALLKRNQLTKHVLAPEFACQNQQKEKTVVQYVGRLRRYLTWWKELSDIEHSFDTVSNLVLRERFVSTRAVRFYVSLGTIAYQEPWKTFYNLPSSRPRHMESHKLL